MHVNTLFLGLRKPQFSLCPTWGAISTRLFTCSNTISPVSMTTLWGNAPKDPIVFLLSSPFLKLEYKVAVTLHTWRWKNHHCITWEFSVKKTEPSLSHHSYQHLEDHVQKHGSEEIVPFALSMSLTIKMSLWPCRYWAWAKCRAGLFMAIETRKVPKVPWGWVNWKGHEGGGQSVGNVLIF